MKHTAKNCSETSPGRSADLRVVKTLALIKEAFHTLISKKSYEELTVTALCAHANIGRKTFYAYYSSLDEIFEEVLEEVTREYIESIKIYTLPENVEEITRKFYEFSSKAGKFYDNLVCSESYQRIGGRLIMKFVKETWENAEWRRPLTKVEQEMLLCFIYNSGLGLYRQWVMGGKTIPMEKMISLAATLLGQGVEGFKNAMEQGK